MLSKQEIEDIIVTALEGGSNYWYFLGDTSVLAIREKVSRDEVPELGPAMAKAIDMGAKVPIYDIEQPNDILGILDKEKIQAGIKKNIADQRTEVWEVKQGDFDAGTADVLFQYFVMNEIVFG